MSERSEDRELTALASAMRELRPQPSAMDRSVLMYRAGRASARGWGWPITTAATTILAAILGVYLLARPAPSGAERIVYVSAPAVAPQSPVVQPPESAPLSAPGPLVTEPMGSSPRGRYLRMQERVLRWGLKGIPPPPQAPPLSQPPTVEQLLKSL